MIAAWKMYSSTYDALEGVTRNLNIDGLKALPVPEFFFPSCNKQAKKIWVQSVIPRHLGIPVRR